MGLGSLLQDYLCVSDMHFWLWQPSFFSRCILEQEGGISYMAVGSALRIKGNSGCKGLWTHHLVSSTISLYTVKALKLVSCFLVEFISW